MRTIAFVFTFAATVPALVPAHADVRAGVEAWQGGRFADAVAEWRPLAIAGDADAQFNLAQAYKLGRGVPADPRLAEQWYQKAALQGHRQAADNYGLILFQNGKRAEAMPYIEDSAGRGEPRAQYVLGTALFNGDLVRKDWPRAYALMTRASAAGIAAASASLAQMDSYIPLDQRQRGLALARAFEVAADKPQTDDLGARPPAAAVSTPRPAKTLAPSGPRPLVQKPPSQPKPAGAAAAPIGNGWRVQLGAFADIAHARSLWAHLRSTIPALGPYTPSMPATGGVIRLQAGPLPSRAAAEKLCAIVAAAPAACLVVPPQPPKR